MSVYAVERLMAEARRIAAEYRRATGRTLPLSGEIAIHDATRLLGLAPAPEGLGYDAVRELDGSVERVQIKGRAIFDSRKAGQRLGNLRLDQPWDLLVLVLMDDQYEPVEIYEADRATVDDAVASGESSRRSTRGPVSVARFRMLARLVWTRESGLGDGVWDSRSGLAT